MQQECEGLDLQRRGGVSPSPQTSYTPLPPEEQGLRGEPSPGAPCRAGESLPAPCLLTPPPPPAGASAVVNTFASMSVFLPLQPWP